MFEPLTRIWRSPTWTTLFIQVVSPLRLLLLTPLILKRLTPIELDVFFLIASTSILFGIFQNRLSNVFIRMLSFAHGGATDLRKWTSEKGNSKSDPNWDLFQRAYLTLGSLLLITSVPSLLLSVGLMWFSVGRLTKFDYSDNMLWAGAALGAVLPALNFALMRPSLALKSTGNIATSNQIAGTLNLACILTSIPVVLLGGGLVGVLLTQLLFDVSCRLAMIRRLPQRVVAYAHRSKWDAEIFMWSKEPLWKGLVGMLAGMGVHRSVGVLLAATGVVGFAAPFLLMQSIFTICQGIASAPLDSQLPRYSQMLKRGDRYRIGADSFLRIIATTLSMAGFVLVASFSLPTVLLLFDSKLDPLPTSDCLLLGGLRVVYWPLICFNLVQGVSNDVKVVWRFVGAVPFAILLFAVGAWKQQYLWFSLGMYLPFILTINWYTWQNYVNFVGAGGTKIAGEAAAVARRRLANVYS